MTIFNAILYFSKINIRGKKNANPMEELCRKIIKKTLYKLNIKGGELPTVYNLLKFNSVYLFCFVSAENGAKAY